MSLIMTSYLIKQDTLHFDCIQKAHKSEHWLVLSHIKYIQGFLILYFYFFFSHEIFKLDIKADVSASAF